MPKYFSKAAILAAYRQMRLLSDEPSKQGQTQKASALRYVTALDAFCAKYHRDCDTTNTDDKAAFTRLVGDVVSIRGSWYTKNFYSGLVEEDGYKVGTNFYSANVVPNSGLDPSRKFTFPKGRGEVLFSVQNKMLLVESIRYSNIASYLPNESLRICFAIWLLRNHTFYSNTDDFDEAVRSALAQSHSEEFVQALCGPGLIAIPDALNSCDEIFVTEAQTITELDIRSLYETHEKPVSKEYDSEDFLSEVFVSEQDLLDMKALLEHNKNLILQGAPGTGKTFAAKRLAWLMLGERDSSRIKMVQFHQNTSYEDMVIGYRPTADGGFELSYGVFAEFCRSIQDESGPYFFIIDEINRANVSKVFGEVLMLIEAGHRGEEIPLSLNGEPFSVPENLYVIGMMNTADRSLALIDYALRRRFAFFDMKPALDNELFIESVETSDDPAMASVVYAVVSLNETISDDEVLGDGYMIGHSYFCSPDASAREIVEYQLAPLLREYWFDNKQKADEEIQRLRDSYNE